MGNNLLGWVEGSIRGADCGTFVSMEEEGWVRGRRPNEARYERASLKEGFVRKIDKMKS